MILRVPGDIRISFLIRIKKVNLTSPVYQEAEPEEFRIPPPLIQATKEEQKIFLLIRMIR